MSKLEPAINLITEVFNQYAGLEGSKNSLNKNELKLMLEKELPGFLKGAKNQQEMDKLMKGLDQNGDQEVDFNEFIVFLAAVIAAFYDRKAKK